MRTTVDDLYGFFGISGIGRGQRLEDSFTSRLEEGVQDLTAKQRSTRGNYRESMVPLEPLQRLRLHRHGSDSGVLSMP